jgi:hypothetical protein
MTDTVAGALALDLVVAWLLRHGAMGAWAQLGEDVRVAAGAVEPGPWLVAGAVPVDAPSGAVATARRAGDPAVTVTAADGWRAAVLATAALDRSRPERDGFVRSGGGRMAH